jgi:peptidoglycan/xylan/chitin deacetylase (PgdA/CDA1 family)
MPHDAYLTIDDAPSVDFLDKLNLLDRHGIPAVWFCQGNFMEQRPEMVIEAIRRGYIIGNHSYSHPSFETISTDQGFAEIRATDAIIDELHARAGIARRRRYFRFPYGNKGHDGDPAQTGSEDGQHKRQAYQEYLRKLGYTPPAFSDITHRFFNTLLREVDWFWTYDSRDWEVNHPEFPPTNFHTHEQVVAALDDWKPDDAPAGSADMILVHDFPGATHALFGKLITRLLEKGFRFKAVSD